MKKILLFSAYLLLAAFIWAQDTVYWCDFDQPSDTAGWQMVNGSQPHYWVIGMDSSMTSNTLFVADIDTFANYYDGRPSVSYACRYITLARGVYHIRFDWRCVGWNGWERFVSTDRERNEIRPSSYMRVALMPGTTTLVPGMYGPEEMWFAPTSLPAGSVAIDGGTPLSEWDASGVPSGEVAPPAGWHTHEYDFVITTPGTYCLAFSWTTDNIFNVVSPPAAIDNLLITSDHCPAPSNVYVDQLRPHSFDLHWTDMSSGRATQWLANCCLASDTTCSGFPYSTNDTTISFTSLLSDRDYIVYLRPQCGADTADTVVRMRVHTPCQFIYLFPYYEDFSVVDSLNVSPFVPCWTRLGRDSTDMVCVSGKLRWRVSGDSPYPDQYLVLQGVNTSVLPINDMQLSFQGRGRLLFDVGVMSNPMDTGSFIPVATINKTLSSWELQRVEL